MKQNNKFTGEKMKVIGLTGGIGSGKSLVARILRDEHNAYIVNTDIIAKEQMEPDGVSYQGVVDYFGTEILKEDGRIDREVLSKILFEDETKRRKINQLTHPNVLKQVLDELAMVRQGGLHPLSIIETALMIESGYYSSCDEVWYVQSDPRIRRKRLKERRGYSDEKIDAIFEGQSKDEDFLRHFSIVIENNGDYKGLKKQVARQVRRSSI